MRVITSPTAAFGGGPSPSSTAPTQPPAPAVSAAQDDRVMSRKMPVRNELLHDRLDALVSTFDVSTISPDPLELVLRYREPRDQEVAGLIAAAFAYGRADIIVSN